VAVAPARPGSGAVRWGMQTVTALRAAAAALPGTQETFPFGLDTLVLKVGGRMYALIGLRDDPLTLSLKCDPARAEALRAEYARVTPGYHLNKRHWNTLTLGPPSPADGAAPLLPDALVLDLLRHSHALVLAGLTRAQREALQAGS